MASTSAPPASKLGKLNSYSYNNHNEQLHHSGEHEPGLSQDVERPHTMKPFAYEADQSGQPYHQDQ